MSLDLVLCLAFKISIALHCDYCAKLTNMSSLAEWNLEANDKKTSQTNFTNGNLENLIMWHKKFFL